MCENVDEECYVCFLLYVLFFKQKTAYEMRISDWSSDVCSSDLPKARKKKPRLMKARLRPPSHRPRRRRKRWIAQTIWCACTCAKWARWNCFPAKADRKRVV